MKKFVYFSFRSDTTILCSVTWASARKLKELDSCDRRQLRIASDHNLFRECPPLNSRDAMSYLPNGQLGADCVLVIALRIGLCKRKFLPIAGFRLIGSIHHIGLQPADLSPRLPHS